MRVVPLFETLNDLTNAPDVINTLFQISTYMGAVKGKQEVMVGYSDSAKDAGRLAACWAQYESQEVSFEFIFIFFLLCIFSRLVHCIAMLRYRS